MKNPLTSAGIEPATFRFVAQHLNHCANAVPIETPVLTGIEILDLSRDYARSIMPWYPKIGIFIA